MILWQNDPASKDVSDYLVDIFCDVASHQAEVKSHFKSLPFVQASGPKGKVVASILELDAWWDDWWQKNPDYCRETSPISRDSFTNYTSDDATRILLLLLLRKILQAEKEHGHSTSPINEAQQILNRQEDRTYSHL